MPVVYIDVLFFVNFIMDYLVLLAVSLLMRCKYKNRRFALSSAVGALYAAGMFFLDTKVVYSLAAKLIMSLVIVWIAYRPETKIQLAKYSLGFVGTSALFGGMLFMLFYFTDSGSKVGAMVKNGVMYFNVSLAYLIGFSLTAYIIIIIYVRKIKYSQSRRFYNIEIGLGGRLALIHALVDTGNTLSEPTTKMPVIVAEKNSITDVLISVDEDSLYTIPYNALGRQNGIISGFKPDYVRIIDERKYVKEVVIGIYDGVLSSTGTYHALINPIAL